MTVHLIDMFRDIRDDEAWPVSPVSSLLATLATSPIAALGRPLGDERFVAELEHLTKRRLRPGKRGPKPKEREPGPA